MASTVSGLGFRVGFWFCQPELNYGCPFAGLLLKNLTWFINMWKPSSLPYTQIMVTQFVCWPSSVLRWAQKQRGNTGVISFSIPKCPRTQIIGFLGPNTTILVVFGRNNPII